MNNLDISKVKGTGPRGRIIKKDLDSILNVEKTFNSEINNTHDKILSQSAEKIPLTNIRKTIASKLQISKQTVPHFYLKSKVSAKEIINARKTFNSLQENLDNKINISFNDIIIKAVASALKIVPEMNCVWNQDSILQFKLVDISVAVATQDGLYTPVIKSSCQKSISEISSEMKYFIKKAKDNKLTPNEYSGGAFSISNLGMYNVDEFTAIIILPSLEY